MCNNLPVKNYGGGPATATVVLGLARVVPLEGFFGGGGGAAGSVYPGAPALHVDASSLESTQLNDIPWACCMTCLKGGDGMCWACGGTWKQARR
jgi:hypothetical protein